MVIVEFIGAVLVADFLSGLLQRIRLVQTPRHHALHHTDPKNSHYCVLTNFLNPILDGLRLWDGLEWTIHALLGVHRRTDTSVSLTCLKSARGATNRLGFPSPNPTATRRGLM